MRKIIYTLLLFMLCLLVFSLVGCPAPDNGDGEEDDGKVYHTVIYCYDNNHDGIYDTADEVRRVESGKPATLYSADPRDCTEHRESTWHYVNEDGTLGEQYNSKIPITADTKLMVKWVLNTRRVAYYLGGPAVYRDYMYGNKIEFCTIEELRAELPAKMQTEVDTWLENATKDGKVFLYWEYERIPWDFSNDTLLEDMVLTPVFGVLPED